MKRACKSETVYMESEYKGLLYIPCYLQLWHSLHIIWMHNHCKAYKFHTAFSNTISVIPVLSVVDARDAFHFTLISASPMGD